MNPALDAAARGAQWLLDHLNSDGSLRGAGNLSAYYKTPAALLWSGHTDAAVKMLGYVRERFLLPSGDLDASGVAWIDQYRIYLHAWLCRAAVEAGETQMAQQLLSYLLTWRNEQSGGFRARQDGTEEIMTTSMAGLACLRAGRMDVAAGVMRWLDRMMQLQPDLSVALHHVWHPELGLVRGDASAAYLVNNDQPRQWYFMFGISAAFLTEYSVASGDAAALALGGKYLHASRHCYSDRYLTPQSGKLGWGAAWMYRQTRSAEDAAIVDAVVKGLSALQCGDGTWNAQGVYEEKPSSEDDSRFDVTAEFVALLAQMGAI